ncbi:MAG: glycine cleavage system protein GcvH [Betaproteobacteria bacterium AqS2]|uniref:Glycine cleavage system H protein n=1 Tax=Candidatus Amphirhobacter heronislandensis TaxID=1732024 RepID=A0A930XWJ4_9GAMM|nr:glycine cleavage system protein GcvH [Betaproteobacteria bacterium AqS2]
MSEPTKWYTQEHEWMYEAGVGVWRIGITDFAQQELGDAVMIELPAVNREVKAGEACAVIESVKTASDVFAPIAGLVVAVNNRLEAAPELVNQSPEDQGWLFEIRANEAVQPKADFMDLETYQASLDA